MKRMKIGCAEFILMTGSARSGFSLIASREQPGDILRNIESSVKVMARRDGSPRKRIDREEDGKPIRLIGAHIDITERVLAKGMLRESEERFRLIADSAPVPMWVTRPDRTRICKPSLR